MTPRLVVVLAGFLLAGCAAAPASDSASQAAGSAPPCPVAPVKVVVSVAPWSDVVTTLGGACAEVATVVTGGSADPHDYEPTVRDIAGFAGARLVVVNGAGYDAWAAKAVEGAGGKPEVVDAADVVGAEAGENPHLWYDPVYVSRVATAVTAAYGRLLPGADGYLADRAQDWTRATAPYRALVASTRGVARGATYLATEPVAAYLADALGMREVTPEGLRRATANESEPTPGDVNDALALLRERAVDVLVVNPQTEGSLATRLRAAATDAGVPVVTASETPSSPDAGFVAWQTAQLTALRDALADGR